MSQSLALSVLCTSKAKKLSHFLENIHHDINHMFHQSSQTAIILLCSFFFCTLTYKQTFSQPFTKAHSCLFGMPLSKDRYYNWIRMQIFSQIFIHVSPSVCCVSVWSYGIQIDYLSKRQKGGKRVESIYRFFYNSLSCSLQVYGNGENYLKLLSPCHTFSSIVFYQNYSHVIDL